MNKVVHFELPMDNPERAMKFYQETFGWQLNPIPEMDYTIVMTVPVDETTHMPKEAGAINGGLTKRNVQTVNVPSFAIDVEDIDVATEKVKAAGGTIVKEKVPVGDMGFIVYFRDTEGNVLSLFQAVRK